jgi:hypothetical protein
MDTKVVDKDSCPQPPGHKINLMSWQMPTWSTRICNTVFQSKLLLIMNLSSSPQIFLGDKSGGAFVF